MTGGLKLTPKTAYHKRFSLTRTFGAPSLDLPARFNVKDEKGDINGPREQGWNFCTACTLSEIGADEWGKPMSQKFQALAISLIRREPLDKEGATIDEAMESGRIYGFLAETDEPADIATLQFDNSFPEDIICEPSSWPADIYEKAIKYQIPGGHFYVDGPYDHFDNFRAALYQHKPDNGIALGILWRYNNTRRDGIVRALDDGQGSGHAIEMEGWETINGTPYIVIRSWNKGMGKNTHFYFSREMFNQMMSVPGAVGKMYKKADENWVADQANRKLTILEQIINIYYQLLFKVAQLNLLKK